MEAVCEATLALIHYELCSRVVAKAPESSKEYDSIRFCHEIRMESIGKQCYAGPGPFACIQDCFNSILSTHPFRLHRQGLVKQPCARSVEATGCMPRNGP